MWPTSVDAIQKLFASTLTQKPHQGSKILLMACTGKKVERKITDATGKERM